MTDRTCTKSVERAARPAVRTARRFGRRGFCRNTEGSVAIEFVALALPFFLLVFAIVESCVAFAAQQVLANATDDVARQFRTGQLKPADLEEDRDIVRDRICAKLEVLVSMGCTDAIEVDLKSYDTFQQAAAKRIAFTGTGSNKDIDTSDFGIDVGESGSKNQLRVFYRWPVMTDFMRKSMSNLQGGKTLLYASVTWQNEPFDD
jgi:Flp pilus assembly protein TadG